MSRSHDDSGGQIISTREFFYRADYYPGVSVAFLSTKTGQFTYFAQQFGESNWRGKNVLDFGGNVGNMLRDPNSTIDHERYWCIDVVNESIEKGKIEFPEAHWVFYDRYCFFFNPCGIRDLPLPQFDQQFDFIVAYSVFTNTPRSDMLQLTSQLEALSRVKRRTRVHVHRSALPFVAGSRSAKQSSLAA